MPATSEEQRRAACVALDVKDGKRSPDSVGEAVRNMAKSMTREELVEFCKSKVES